MLVPFVACIVLMILGRDELGAGWILGIIGFLALSLVMVFVLNIYPIAFVVPVVLVDIGLILKVFGSDITLR